MLPLVALWNHHKCKKANRLMSIRGWEVSYILYEGNRNQQCLAVLVVKQKAQFLSLVGAEVLITLWWDMEWLCALTKVAMTTCLWCKGLKASPPWCNMDVATLLQRECHPLWAYFCVTASVCTPTYCLHLERDLERYTHLSNRVRIFFQVVIWKWFVEEFPLGVTFSFLRSTGKV